jgi:hypothetical protein
MYPFIDKLFSSYSESRPHLWFYGKHKRFKTRFFV